MRTSLKRQKGIALLLVLWALALLSLLLGGLAGWVQLETRQGLWLRQHTRALLAAEAGMNQVVQILLDSSHRPRWIADGRGVPLRFDEAQLVVGVTSERGKLDLNAATVEDITRVVQACGADRDQAAQLVKALQARRGGDEPPLRVLEELRQLPGMTQILYSRLLPELTLWSGLPRPEPTFASPLLRRALNMPNQTTVGADPGDVVTIESQAQLPSGFSARLLTTVLLNSSEGNAQPYRVLRWQE
ncbi:general secretion pathway protein K [Pseudomonas fluorescens]|uniref:general secretion pathway protein GspK n=1 Tax=Pseudomonas fluorescens TaxID=294 RepID=UPI00209D7F2D|nr:general secretion pathway protein GspK [Pseudomonas fluorescens]MCP1484634.1 general secretion pathway protein K [Pseudomonas fluorescens]